MTKLQRLNCIHVFHDDNLHIINFAYNICTGVLVHLLRIQIFDDITMGMT